jgi:hypothetical protein
VQRTFQVLRRRAFGEPGSAGSCAVAGQSTVSRKALSFTQEAQLSYMKSLSPKRELAAFLELRALCLKQNELHERRLTVKLFADGLRRKEGVDLDRLNRLMRQYANGKPIPGTIGPALPYQTLTNTNSWRAPGNERGAPGKNTVFATDRFGPE